MKRYKHLFFDLDNTVWDLDTNSKNALFDLFLKYSLSKYFDSLEQFRALFYKYHWQLWNEYLKGKVKREELRILRFCKTLEECGIQNNHLANKMAGEYNRILPLKDAVFPKIHETLSTLKKQYKLHILTNGFYEVQIIKLTSGKLLNYFDLVITPDKAGALKPNALIYQYALTKTNAKSHQCLAIGDEIESDIRGANENSWDSVYFNRNNPPPH